MIARVALGIVAALIVAVAAIYLLVSPPRILSWLDAAFDGGRATEEVASAVPFGDHGQTLDVWRPTDGEPNRPHPVLIFYYGGGWAKGDRASYAFAARAYAHAGFVVVVPNYRKVPNVRFPAFVQDSADAVKWTRDNIAGYGGDPKRIAVAGHSAGAYNAVLLAMDPRWLTAVGVDPHVIKAAVGLCGPYDFYPFDKKRSIEAFKGVANGPATQPILYARAGLPPMLLVTSTADTEVRPYNAVHLARALEQVGAPVEMIEYKGLSHEEVVMALSKPFRDKAPVLADSVAFLRRTLR